MNPESKYCFTLTSNDDDEFEVPACHPSLDSALMAQLVGDLNEDKDMNDFIRSIRLAFVESLDH
jgi:hypothetical protein